MKLYTAVVWWDLMDDMPEVFVHLDETLLESQIWTEFNAKFGEDFEPYVGEVSKALSHAGGRVLFDCLEIPNFGIVSQDVLHRASVELLATVDNGDNPEYTQKLVDDLRKAFQ